MEEKKIPLYENIFTPTEKDVGDYVVHLLKKRTAISVMVSLFVLTAIFALWWWLGEIGILTNPVSHLMAALLLLVSIMVTDTVMKHREYHTLVKQFKHKNQVEMAGVKTLFYEDELDANGKIHKYSEFSKVLYGESCMFLVSEKKKMFGERKQTLKVLMIKDDADAFGKGDHASFWDFLENKCKLEPEEKPSKSPFKFFRSPPDAS